MLTQVHTGLSVVLPRPQRVSGFAPKTLFDFRYYFVWHENEHDLCKTEQASQRKEKLA